MVRMQTTHELEETDQSPLTQSVQVKMQTRVIEIVKPSLGLDFIMGSDKQSVCLIPLTSILEVSGLEALAKREVSFEEVLAAQQQPVMIHYFLPERLSWAWLLTVSNPWLRLAHPHGVIWVPLARISHAEIRLLSSVKRWDAE
jgi:hypothetical protein